MISNSKTSNLSVTNSIPEPREYFCHECSKAFKTISEARLHIERKTSWNNLSLVGCYISWFDDAVNWRDGIVIDFVDSTGYHCVEDKNLNETILLEMTKVTFYIIQRPTRELKDGYDEHNIYSAEKRNFCEEISEQYVEAQSLLFEAYGGKLLEKGHKTVGHLCVTEMDKVFAKQQKSYLKYGELLPKGVNKAFGRSHLDGFSARIVYDLGMGLGKVAMQVFLQFTHIKHVYGIELCEARYNIAVNALKRLVDLCPSKYFISFEVTNTRIQLKSSDNGRVLEFECGNLFNVKGIESVDIILFETDLPRDKYTELSNFIHQIKDGARMLTYLDMQNIWSIPPFPLRQIPINISRSDRYSTSWSVERGHHFYLWWKMCPSQKSTSKFFRCTPWSHSSYCIWSQFIRAEKSKMQK